MGRAPMRFRVARRGGAGLVLAGAAALSGPAERPSAAEGEAAQSPEVRYNADFTFTRVRYGSDRGGMRYWRRGGASWAHDYPDADLNMQVILAEITSMHPNVGASNVFDLEDPGIFQHPLLYLSEPGFWRITDEGARNLREHLLKGGFIIFDDFEAEQWRNFQAQLARALPEYELIEIDDTHPVFRSFFHVEDIYVPHPLVSVTPRYFGVFEGNDPSGRMMVLVNYNADLAEYWEWSATGHFPVDPTNDAYRLGVNYITYAMTH